MIYPTPNPSGAERRRRSFCLRHFGSDRPTPRLRTKPCSLAIGLVLALALSAGSALAIPVPQDDVILAVAGHEVLIRDRILLMNDNLGPWDVDNTWIEILTTPGSDFVEVGSSQESTWSYTPSSDDPTSRDSFTYRLTDGFAPSPQATVTVRISPPLVPLSGRWRTLQPATSPCAQGDGEELGWYDSATATFHLCDLEIDVPELRHCQSLAVPTAGVGETPLVGDWNGDGLDEVALHDPTSRQLRFFEIDYPTSCPDLASSGTLVPTTTMAWDGDDLQGVVGTWLTTPGNPGETLGFFDPDREVVELLAWNHGQSPVTTLAMAPTSIGHPVEMAQALSRPWSGGAHRLGYFYRLARQLLMLDQGSFVLLDPQVETDLVLTSRAQPVLGYWPRLRNVSNDRVYWAGFFEPGAQGASVGIFYLLRDAHHQFADDDPRMPRYVQVVVDPPK